MRARENIAPGAPPGDLTGIAAHLDEILARIAGVLDAAQDPDRLAMRSLGVDRYGHVTEIYDDEAFAIWSKKLALQPDDVGALHHLAIMHHARALDLEASEDPQRADEDWRQALELWHQLWQSEAFWDQLVETAGTRGKPESIQDLRRRLPVLLLGILYAIAVDPDTPRVRVNHLVRLVKDSAFAAADKEQARTEAYERHASRIPSHIWQTPNPEIHHAEGALATIRDFLERDSECRLALEDALGVAIKVLRSRFTDLNASDTESARRSVLEDARRSAQEWWPYFERFRPMAEILEEGVRRDLCLWCRVNADLMRAIGDEESAERYLRLGVDVGMEAGEEAKACRRNLVVLLAQRARDEVSRDENLARKQCDVLRSRSDLTILAHMLLANAYVLMDEYTVALEVCEAGRALEPDHSVHRFLEEDEQALDVLDELTGLARARRAFAEAVERFDADRHGESLTLLDEAISLRPGEPDMHFLRSRCLLALQQTGRALEDVRRVLDTPGLDETVAQAATSLEQLIRQRAREIEQCGKKAAQRLVRADEALETADVPGATSHLEAALKVCRSKGKSIVQKKLSALLATTAVDGVNRTIEKTDLTRPQRVQQLARWRDTLERACRLDATNDHARTNLKTLKEIMADLDRQDRRHRALAAAAQSFKDLRYDDAIRWQRTAIENCDPDERPHLEKNLAAILQAKAVAMVNGLTSDDGAIDLDPGRVLSKAGSLLDDARRLDPENRQVLQNREAVAARQQEVAEHGVEASRHLLQADKALTRENVAEAITHLETALKVCKSRGKPAVRKRLSALLAGRAVEEVNRIMDATTATTGQRVERLTTWSEALERACRLDPANDHARTNLATIREILKDLKRHDGLRQAVEGAAAAFRRNEFDEATRLQRIAIDRCDDDTRPVLERNLAKILEAKAVGMVNAETSGHGGVIGATPAILREAKSLLAEAHRLAPEDPQILANLKALLAIMRSLGLD